MWHTVLQRKPVQGLRACFLLLPSSGFTGFAVIPYTRMKFTPNQARWIIRSAWHLVVLNRNIFNNSAWPFPQVSWLDSTHSAWPSCDTWLFQMEGLWPFLTFSHENYLNQHFDLNSAYLSSEAKNLNKSIRMPINIQENPLPWDIPMCTSMLWKKNRSDTWPVK